MLTFATDWWILWSHLAYEVMPNEEILIVNLLSINCTFCSVIVCKKWLHAVRIMLNDSECLSMTMKSKGNHKLLRERKMFACFVILLNMLVWAIHSYWPRSWEVTRLKVRLGFAEMMRGSGEFVTYTLKPHFWPWLFGWPHLLNIHWVWFIVLLLLGHFNLIFCSFLLCMAALGMHVMQNTLTSQFFLIQPWLDAQIWIQTSRPCCFVQSLITFDSAQFEIFSVMKRCDWSVCVGTCVQKILY